jgi:hypothetical protein
MVFPAPVHENKHQPVRISKDFALFAVAGNYCMHEELLIQKRVVLLLCGGVDAVEGISLREREMQGPPGHSFFL